MNLLNSNVDDSGFTGNVLSAINIPVILADLNGKILFANNSVNIELGYFAEEIIGKEVSILLTPEDQDIFYHNLLCLGCKESSFKGELMLVRKDNTRFLSYLTAETCSGPDVDNTSMVICIQNISELKQLEKEHKVNSYEDLTQIASGIAHEIRNPLVGIGGFLNRLYRSCNAIDEHGKYYEFIIENLTKIEGLIEKVEFFSKLPEPLLSKERIWGLAEEAVKPYLPDLNKRNIELVIDKEDTELHLDPDHFMKVVSVLIENAMDALKENGKITIHGEKQGNQYIIYATDNGSGISPEYMPFIFNPFFSTKADGAGIDLAIVKRIMENHNGSVEIESGPAGTTFSLRFPIERRRSIRIKRID